MRIKTLTCSLFTIWLISVCFASYAQNLTIVASDTTTSLRGLSVVDENVIWVSGSNGRVGRSIDGGQTWIWLTVSGAEKRDLRDIEAFDKNRAIVMAVAEPALIFKTIDGGQTWKQVYENSTKGMFLDAMEFWNEESGIVLGDPIDSRFFISRTFDGGESWEDIPLENRPIADSGEACFAASGTNIRGISRTEAVFVTGGKVSRLFQRNSPITLPLLQGKETTGANSIAVFKPKRYKRSKRLVVVGGDFANDKASEKNCFITTDGGKSWIAPSMAPDGYKSSVEYITKLKLITCGTSGVDVSSDGGMNWRSIGKESFHVCRKAKKGKAVYLAGSKGKIARLEW